MKQSPQSRKLNEALRSALAEILLLHVSDPRLAMITITSVEVSKDRGHANIYVSAERKHYADVETGLSSAKGRIRALLGKSLGWRVTPELHFFLDTSIDDAERISQALNDVPKTMDIQKDEEGYPL